MDDDSLLKAFAHSGDQQAFRELTDRHIHLVYASARRQVRNAHLAEDVTQAVFSLLARKASSIHGRALTAWLLKATQYISRDMLKKDTRRVIRERKAAMTMTSTASAPTGCAETEHREISEILDQGLATLRDQDRSVISLRYLEERPMEEVATNLGLTVPATRKRLERAMTRLKDSFARHGVILSIDALPAALAVEALSKAPPSLSDSSASIALSSPALPFYLQLWAMTLSFTAPKLIATTLVTMIAVISGVTLYSRAMPHPHSYVSSATFTAKSSPVRVGVILSEATAIGWRRPADTPYDLHHQSIVEYLHSPELDLYAIIEPGQQSIFGSYLQHYFAPDHVILGNDVARLRSLEVIVAGHNWHMRKDVLDAVYQAVSEGTAFFQQSGFAKFSPSFTPQVCDLNGIDNGSDFEHSPIDARVVESHPILGNLKPGDVIHTTTASGVIGKLRGKPLIAAPGLPNQSSNTTLTFISAQLKHPATLPASAKSEADGDVFYPLYISQLGKGTIIGCQWHDRPPVELDPQHDGTFYVRCFKWLANRPLD